MAVLFFSPMYNLFINIQLSPNLHKWRPHTVTDRLDCVDDDTAVWGLYYMYFDQSDVCGGFNRFRCGKLALVKIIESCCKACLLKKILNECKDNFLVMFLLMNTFDCIKLIWIQCLGCGDSVLECQFYLYSAFTDCLAAPKCFTVKCNIAGRHKNKQ